MRYFSYFYQVYIYISCFFFSLSILYLWVYPMPLRIIIEIFVWVENTHSMLPGYIPKMLPKFSVQETAGKCFQIILEELCTNFHISNVLGLETWERVQVLVTMLWCWQFDDHFLEKFSKKTLIMYLNLLRQFYYEFVLNIQNMIRLLFKQTPF